MGTSRTLNNGLMTIGTFRSTADVHAFARKDLHRSLMKLYRTLPAERAEMFEIWHELYTVSSAFRPSLEGD